MTFADDHRTWWRGRRVFVTGANGLVGRSLVERLRGLGAEAVGFVRARAGREACGPEGAGYEVAVGRLEDYAVLERTISERGFDVVFHLGAQAIVETARREPRETLEANVAGTWNVLEACRRSRTPPRVVVASTDRLYRASGPAEGGHSKGVADVYGVSKLCAEEIVKTYSLAYDLPVVIARTANVFGPEDVNFSRLIPGTIRAVLSGNPPVILSDGSPVHDYIYVEDVGEAYLCLAEALDGPGVQGMTMNVGSGVKTSVLDLSRMIIRLMGRSDLEPEVRGAPSGAKPASATEEANAGRLAGWKPRYSLEQALQETIAWYRAHPERVSATAVC